MSEDLLPQAAVHLNKQLNSGMPTSNPDNERIQRNETYFLFNIPIDMTYPFTSKAQEDHGGLDCAGGPKRLAHGRAFHHNATEKRDLRLRKCEMVPAWVSIE